MPLFIAELIQGIHVGQSLLYVIFGAAIMVILGIGKQHG
jgi:hypothetical protein